MAKIVPDLSNRSVAIVAMGRSSKEYINEASFKGGKQALATETWAINTMGGIIQCDRVFMMDDPRRFFDTDLAGEMGNGMSGWLPFHPGPVYTCTLDPRVPNAVEFPLEEVMNTIGAAYFSTTVAYAVGFAIAANVKSISLYGYDFEYRDRAEGKEHGRACVEFLLSLAISKGIQVAVAEGCSLLDTDLPPGKKLYGYLEDVHAELTPEGKWKKVLLKTEEDEIVCTTDNCEKVKGA